MKSNYYHAQKHYYQPAFHSCTAYTLTQSGSQSFCSWEARMRHYHQQKTNTYDKKSMHPCSFSISDNLGTFIERPAGQDISSVGKARPSGTDGSVLRWAWFGTLLTVDTPCRTHWTAAHVHTVSPWQGLATLILVPLHVTLLTTHI